VRALRTSSWAARAASVPALAHGDAQKTQAVHRMANVVSKVRAAMTVTRVHAAHVEVGEYMRPLASGNLFRGNSTLAHPALPSFDGIRRAAAHWSAHASCADLRGASSFL
jgi:hypothetical protein